MNAAAARPAADIIVETSLGRVRDLVALADAVIGPNADTSAGAYYEWLYGGNPEGPAIQASAYQDGRMVAHYAVVPLRWCGPDGARLVGLGVNALTRNEAQGRGLFARLVARADAAAAERGIAATYVMPGPASEPWFSTVLRYRSCGELALVVRPARVRRLGSQLTGRLGAMRPLLPLTELAVRLLASIWRARSGRRETELRDVTVFDDEFDALWTRASAGWTLGVVRDCTFFRWRYSTPTRTYRTMGAWCDGRLAAAVVYRAKETRHLAGGAFGSIVDVLAESTVAGRRAAALLVAEAVARMTADGADVTVCQMRQESAAVRALRRNGFVRVPGRHAGFRPVLVRGLNCGPSASGHLTGADYDMG